MSFFFNFKKTPPTDFQTEFFRWYFTESWKIFTAYAAIIDGIFMSVYFQWEFFFCAHFPSVKPSVFFFTDRMSNYWRMLCRWTLSVGNLVGKKFNDEVAILHRRIWSVGKTIKCCCDKWRRNSWWLVKHLHKWHKYN